MKHVFKYIIASIAIISCVVTLYSITPEEILQKSDGKLYPEILTYRLTIDTKMENGHETRYEVPWK